MRVRVCVCVCARVLVRVRVCVWVYERERERESACARACGFGVYVCMQVFWAHALLTRVRSCHLVMSGSPETSAGRH